MKKTIKKQLEKDIASIYLWYVRGMAISEIAEIISDNVVDAINKKKLEEIKELNKLDLDLRASKKSCACEENIPKSNIDSKN